LQCTAFKEFIRGRGSSLLCQQYLQDFAGKGRENQNDCLKMYHWLLTGVRQGIKRRTFKALEKEEEEFQWSF
jgi:hypothetical protein